jgi:hypothetical protein
VPAVFHVLAGSPLFNRVARHFSAHWTQRPLALSLLATAKGHDGMTIAADVHWKGWRPRYRSKSRANDTCGSCRLPSISGLSGSLVKALP